MCLGQFSRIARVSQIFKLHALDDAAGVHVEASDNPFRQHVGAPVSDWQLKASKNCPASLIRSLRISPDETARQTDDPVPLPQRIGRHTRSTPPSLRSAAPE